MRLGQDLVDDWELQDAWPLTRSSDELLKGTHEPMCSRGGGSTGG